MSCVRSEDKLNASGLGCGKVGSVCHEVLLPGKCCLFSTFVVFL